MSCLLSTFAAADASTRPIICIAVMNNEQRRAVMKKDGTGSALDMLNRNRIRMLQLCTGEEPEWGHSFLHLVVDHPS